MLTKIYSGAVLGLHGMTIEVEVDVAERGFPTFTIVGLPNKAVDEAKDRVRTALANSGYPMPDSRLTVNLAPANVPKTGSGFDLPIAIGVLAAQGLINSKTLTRTIFIGELSLEGQVRSIPGILPIAVMAKETGYTNIFVPNGNAEEAALVPNLCVYSANTLREVIAHINNEQRIIKQPQTKMSDAVPAVRIFDMEEIKGQYQAKRAFEIAASGFHNLHLTGVPGAGKTMLSRAFASILPPLEMEEVLEVSQIYSIAGLLANKPYIATRPFRAPHHTTSRIGLIGGGSIPTPGEISLAHRGVLFLDEFPEFPRLVLEALRQPMEDGIVSIARAAGTLTFPARFLLLAASNPCPCGYLGHPEKPCTCMPGMVQRYAKRLSGPLLDRIDIHLAVAPVSQKHLSSPELAESSETIRSRVIAARARQTLRFKQTSLFANSEMTPHHIKMFCHISDDASAMLSQAIRTFSLSARSYFKIIKTAQTIADLGSSDTIEKNHMAEALQYRTHA